MWNYNHAMAPLSRRALIVASAALLARAQNLKSAVAAADHLLLGVSDLDRGIRWVEQRTGIRATVGGVHPGQGTRNALLSLGAGHYLEIIAPDPAQTAYNAQVDVRKLTEPRLVNFAVTSRDIAKTTDAATQAGYKVLGPVPGSRVTPSGATLKWKSLRVTNSLGAGGIEPAPFFIEWDADSPHPSKTSPPGCELKSLEFHHPRPLELAAYLKTFGLEARISRGPARIIATLKTPKGRLELT